MSSYTGSLAPDDSNVSLWTLIPRPTYDSDNGIGFLKNSITIPMGDCHLVYPSMQRWLIILRLGLSRISDLNGIHGQEHSSLHYAKEESSLNDDHVWVEKKPSLSFDSSHFYIPELNSL